MVVHVRDMRDHTDWGGYVVNEIVATHVSLASRPRRVAPLMAAAMYVNLSAGGNDRANRILGAGAAPQIQIAGGVRKVGLCIRSRQREDQCRASAGLAMLATMKPTRGYNSPGCHSTLATTRRGFAGFPPDSEVCVGAPNIKGGAADGACVFDALGFEVAIDIGIGEAGVDAEVDARDFASIAPHDRFENALPAIGAVNVPRPQGAALQIAELVEGTADDSRCIRNGRSRRSFPVRRGWG